MQRKEDKLPTNKGKYIYGNETYLHEI